MSSLRIASADLQEDKPMSDLESELERAMQHVAAAEHIVVQQRERIARLQAGGHPTAEHQQLLEVFVSTLEALNDHRRLLLSEIAEMKTNSK